MDNTLIPLIRSFVQRIFGTIIRHGLTSLGLWIASKGVGSLEEGTINNLTDLIVGVIVIVVSFALSFYKAKKSDIAKAQVSVLKEVVLNQAQSQSATVDAWKPEHRPPSVPPAVLLLLPALLLLSGCAAMSKRDQNSIDTINELKPMSVALVGKAKEPAERYLPDIAYLETRGTAAVAYEQGKGKANAISAKQWQILFSEDQELLGRLLKNWKEGKPFSPAYLTEKQEQIGLAWDEILRLEGAKEVK